MLVKLKSEAEDYFLMSGMLLPLKTNKFYSDIILNHIVLL